jgi:hypothetical protein
MINTDHYFESAAPLYLQITYANIYIAKISPWAEILWDKKNKDILKCLALKEYRIKLIIKIKVSCVNFRIKCGVN